MDDCMYCHAELGAEDGRLHDACVQEWWKRANASKCVYCGEADIGADVKDVPACRRCYDVGLEYSGYPGDQ